MRIAQVTPYFYPHIGGVESHVYRLSQQLIRKGHEVSVITSKLPNSPTEERIEGIRVRRVNTIFTLFKTPITPKVGDEIKGYDIVHAHSPPPLTAYFASRRCDAPFVLTYHCDLEVPREVPTIFRKLLVSFYRVVFDEPTLARVDKLLVTSTQYASTSRALWKQDAVVIPNAVDTDRFNPNLDGTKIRKKHRIGDALLVLLVGRLVPHKGIEYLIDSAKHTKARYLIVGAGPLKRKLVRRATNRIIFAGKVSDEELPYYYAACDLLVLPSIERLEAFGIVGLEAMSSGKPIIITDIPGVREIIEEGEQGLIVEPMNSVAIAEKINLLRDDKVRCKMGKKARERVMERFAWDKVIGKIEEVYTKIINTR